MWELACSVCCGVAERGGCVVCSVDGVVLVCCVVGAFFVGGVVGG